MPRYRIALRLAKPYQCLYCTLMPEFDCDHLPLDVADALDETFRTMSAIPLVSDGEGSGPGDSIVDIVHRNRELTTAHSTVYSIIVRALTLAARGTPDRIPALPGSPFSSVAGA